MPNYNQVYINYTSQQMYDKIKKFIQTGNDVSSDTINRYNHTLFIVNCSLPTLNSSACNIYLGSQIISDIINLNLFNEITIEEDENTGYLTVIRDNIPDTLIGNKNKLYLYCRYNFATADSFFNIYYYDEIIHKYVPITKDGATTGSINYVTDESLIDDVDSYVPEILVYYDQ